VGKFLEFSGDNSQNRRYIAELLVAFTFAVLAAYVLLTIVSPLLITSENSLLRGIAATTYLFDVYMCHEMPERSFAVGGQHMPLCERCFAIAAGALIAYPAAFWRRHFPKILSDRRVVIAAIIASMGILGIDGAGQLLGLWESITAVRVFTGVFSAFTVMFYLLCEVREKFPPRGSLFRPGVVLPAAIPFAALLLAVLAASAVVGSEYKSRDYVVGEAAALNPRGAAGYDAFYIAPRAFSGTISADPYLQSYSDPVLHDIASLGTRRHELGGWAVLALNGPAEYEGKYAFVSGGNGNYYYFDAWTGELVAARRHGG